MTHVRSAPLIVAVAFCLLSLPAFGDESAAKPPATAAEAIKPAPPAKFEVNKEWRGKQFVQIAKGAGGAAWAPDGRRIGYVRQQLNQVPRPLGGPLGPPTPILVDNSVVVLDLATGVEQQVALNEGSSARVDLLAWAADGKTAFAADASRIWAVDVSDKGLKSRVLVDSFADGRFRSLGLAADQKHLVCRYEPATEGPDDSVWMTVKFAVFDLAGKETERGSGKEGSWGFRFSAKGYFAATAREGLKAKDGYTWGVLPLARSADGAELVVVQEEPAKADVLPMSDGLRIELAWWAGPERPGPNAFRKLDSFVYNSARGTAVECQAMNQGAKVLRVRREGFFQTWGGGSRRGTYGVRGTEEKTFVSLLDVTSGKFGPETERPLHIAEAEAKATYRPRYELIDVDDAGRTAAFWFYFDYRGIPADKKWQGLAVLDLSRGICRTATLRDGLSIDRLRPPRLQPQGRLLLVPYGDAVWLCDVEGK